MSSHTAPLWAPQAWIQGTWREGVVLETGGDGRWSRVSAGQAGPDGAQRLAGPVLPGLVDAHSHAFQRAFAGLAEERAGSRDDFWSWRDHMYRVANVLTPAMLRAIAAHLYIELLRGGYTQVCEFHYLQHQPDGRPYDDPLALSLALAEAAAEAGIGLTLLPVLYERAGFDAPGLRPDQRRFRHDADAVWRHASDFGQRVARQARAPWPPVRAGLAIHSLRAAAPASITRLRALAQHFDGPIHLHVAEQAAEVHECLAATGRRPIEALAADRLLDARWHLVHATHAQPHEIAAVAAAGAGVVLCPSTEANLGDGFTDVPAWLDAGVALSVGSDSHIGRDWREELRWIEYGQRLRLQRRNLCARPGDRRPQAHTAAVLFERTLAGGARAAGFDDWGLRTGARADLLVADADDPALAGLPTSHLLDALVFSAPTRPWRDVMVAGRWVLRDRQPQAGRGPAERFTSVMQTLWGATG